MKFLTKSLLLLVIVMLNMLFTTSMVKCNPSSQDEIIEDDDEDDVVVNSNDGGANEQQQQQQDQEQQDGTAQDDGTTTGASPHIQTHLLFVKPETLEFPAGKVVRLVASMRNTGDQHGFIIDTIDASLRYPQEFQYHIQNFTAFEYGKLVENEREATFEYAFTPNEVFAGRPFGLVVNVNYRSNSDGKQFTSVLFNNTIQVVDFDEGLDGETFFLYIFLAAIVVLLAVVVQHYFSTAIRKRVGGSSSSSSSSSASAAGRLQSNGGGNSQQSGDDEVDYEWIPKEHLQQAKQQSPRKSPRLRQTQRGTAAGQSSGDEQ